MSLVHLVQHSSGLTSCLAHVADGDALLLLGDGVYAAADPRLAAAGVPVAVIGEDATARGVAIASPVAAIGYDGFVALVVEHDASVTWS